MFNFWLALSYPNVQDVKQKAAMIPNKAPRTILMSVSFHPLPLAHSYAFVKISFNESLFIYFNMMKKLLNGFVIIVTLFILYKVIMEKVLVYDSINYALNIWVNNLIPTLFPFFIISDILINFNLNEYIPKFLKNICKFLFNINDNMLTILILSIISGFPSNARITRALYDEGFITCEDASQILTFTHFANPLFVLSTVSCLFLNKTLNNSPIK